MPIFTICIVIFLFVLTSTIRKNNRTQTEVNEAFWARERQSNTVRKQDISKLDYISIPLEKFPLNLGTPSEDTLKALSNEKILNLTGLSNTDLKLSYGAANLDELTRYDENFTTLVKALAAYAKELLDARQVDDAQTVLEYAVSIKSDSTVIYTMLASIYREQGQQNKIDELLLSAEQLNSLSKQVIKNRLLQG